jgi:hypothetical protein
MARRVGDAINIMRLAISRRNVNDPDSTDEVLLGYLNDFVSLNMGADVQLFEQYGTLNFDITETVTDGVYTFNEVGDSDFESISEDGFIKNPDNDYSWTPLKVYFDPNEFYSYWGVENTDVLVTGMPSEVLFYDNELVFRTIPDDTYSVTLYGYKREGDFSTEGDPILKYDYWLRFIAYGAALNYAKDYRYDDKVKMSLRADYAAERNRMLTRTHNQIKHTRGAPSF